MQDRADFFFLLFVQAFRDFHLDGDVLIAALAGVFAFSSFWTIKELFEQQERVRKGWFPANPKRRTKQACRTEEEKR